MVVSWLREFVVDVLTVRPIFDSGSVRVEFAMDAVALGQVLLRVLVIYLSLYFHHSSTLILHSSTSDDI